MHKEEGESSGVPWCLGMSCPLWAGEEEVCRPRKAQVHDGGL